MVCNVLNQGGRVGDRDGGLRGNLHVVEAGRNVGGVGGGGNEGGSSWVEASLLVD